ncbi:OB-fold protein [Terrisporobacter glycolicus]|uniref:OB-fold protein n=1 Tax=Terrisporobacter glycolicus TaxID=36841 RepID=UPI003463BCD2
MRRKRVLTIIFIITFTITGMLLYSTFKNMTKNTEFKNCNDKNKIIEVSSKELLHDYINDRDKANEKYEDFDLKITGAVKKLYLEESENVVDALTVSPQSSEYRIILHAEAEEYDKIAKIMTQLKENDSITATGHCHGAEEINDNDFDITIYVYDIKKNN